MHTPTRILKSGITLAAAASLCALLALPAGAQGIGSAEQLSAPEVSALRQQVERLEERLKKLEERLEKPLTVKAPFIVADATGQAVFRVSNNKGRELLLGSEAEPILRAYEAGGDVFVEAKAGGSYVGMKATNGGPAMVAASTGTGYARLYSAAGEATAVEATQGRELAQLRVLNNHSALKLWTADKPYFHVSAETGSPQLKLGDATTPAFEVKDGNDEVTARLTKGPSIVQLAGSTNWGSRVTVEGGGGGRRASLGSHKESAFVMINGEAGGEVPTDAVYLGMASEGPYLGLRLGGKTRAHLGTPEGKQPALRFYDPEERLAMTAGLGAIGRPGVSLWKNDEAYAVLMQNDEGEGVLELARPGGKPAVELGRLGPNKQPALRIYDESGAVALGAGLDTEGVPAVRVVSQGKVAADMSVDSAGRGRFALQDSGGKLVLQLKDSGNGAGSFELYSGGNLAAQLGRGTQSNTALRFYMGSDKPLAAIGVDSAGQGSMRVFNASGGIAAALSAGAESGQAVVYLKSGKPAAALATTGSGGGIVQVYADTGEAIGSLTQGANGGLLQLNNLGGVPMVEAGNNGQVGVVRAGPLMRPGGVLGLPGSFIMGSTGRK